MAAPLNADIKSTILRSCEKLLGQQSFAAISLADIARAAGVSKGTLYYYYKNKDDILFDIADGYLDAMAVRLRQWTEDPAKDTSYKRLMRYAFRDGVYDESGSLRLHLVAAAVSGNEALRARLLGKYNFFKEMLAKLIAQRLPAADAEHHAWMLLTMMDGLLVQSRLGNTELDVSAFIEKTIVAMEEIGE